MTSSALVARIILLITISTINTELSRAESNRGSQDLIPRTSLTSEQRIELSGEVLISRSADLGQNLVITSESFVFVPQKNFGETLSPVTINLGQNTIKAAKLSIDLNKEELRLDSSSTQYVSSEVFGKSQK